MKTYRHLYRDMLNPEVVSRCALDAADGKISRPEVVKFFKDFDKSYDYIIKCIKNPDYNPNEKNTHSIIDGAHHKQRVIEKPRFCPEQVLHHMIVYGFKPVVLNGLYEQIYGCLPQQVIKSANVEDKLIIRKYGVHAAVHQLTKWLQIKSKLYVCEADIHHAYPSVHIATLVRMLQEVIKDDDWLKLVYKFLHYNPDDPESENVYGLVLGHYTSPWFFNFYLKKFDHYMAAMQDVKYLRFADNIFLIGPNKRKVHRAKDAMIEYLRTNLRLELNKSLQVFRFEWYDTKTEKVRGRAVNALGSVIHYNRVTARKSTLQRMRRKANRINKKQANNTVSWHDAASMLARLPLVRHTNTYKYYEKNIKSKIKIPKLKQNIKDYTKATKGKSLKERTIIHDGLAKSTKLNKADGV